MNGRTQVGADQVASAKGVDIEVIADPVGGGIQWSLNIKDSKYGKGNKVELPKDSNYKLSFTLDDRTNLKLRFDASAPLFVRSGGAGPCPTAISTPQIMVDSCDSRALVVINWNYGPLTELYYQLNFVDQNGLREYAYDPPIINGGGGTQPQIGG